MPLHPVPSLFRVSPASRGLRLAVLGAAALCGCSRPDPAPVAAPPAPVAAAPAPTPPAPPREPGAYETPRPPPGREPTPLPDLAEDEAAASSPRAGRRVLRCREQGRITYVELTARCAEGDGEPVTVFPTAGVEVPR